MSAKTNYAQTATLNLLLAAGGKLALYTAAPDDSGGGTEVSGGDYQRMTINAMGGSSPAFTTPGGAGSTPRVVQNSGIVIYPIATANWGTIVAIGIFDSTNVHLLYHTSTSPTDPSYLAPFDVLINQALVLPDEYLTVQEN